MSGNVGMWEHGKRWYNRLSANQERDLTEFLGTAPRGLHFKDVLERIDQKGGKDSVLHKVVIRCAILADEMPKPHPWTDEFAKPTVTHGYRR